MVLKSLTPACVKQGHNATIPVGLRLRFCGEKISIR